MSPEERQSLIRSYGVAYDKLEAALTMFPKSMWTYRSRPEEWTIHEIVIHLADSEVNSYIRCRRLIAEPESELMAYDEVGWARALHYHDQSPIDALRLFRQLRAATYDLIRTLPDTVWGHRAHHGELGVITLEDWLLIYERHVREHVAQMRLVHEAWREAQRMGADGSSPVTEIA